MDQAETSASATERKRPEMRAKFSDSCYRFYLPARSGMT